MRCNLVKESLGWRARVLHDGRAGDDGATQVGPSPPHTVVTTTPTGHEYVSAAPALPCGVNRSVAPADSPVELVLRELLALAV